jgi:O-antigen ligase
LTEASPLPQAPRTTALVRWLGAAAAAWLFVDAAFATSPHPGVSTFGNPPELAVAWLACAAGWASALARAPDRLAVARRLVLALLVATLLGRRMVPADPGLRLALLGVTLWAAAPWLRLRAGAGVTLLALALALPGALFSELPQGSLLWLAYVLPPAALALLVPAVLPGRAAFRAATTLLLATSAACAAALACYPVLARGLELPLAAVLPTRLHLLGLHPNLAVPHLATTLVVGAALVAVARRRGRVLLLLALAPVAGALLAVQSRTGLLATGFGLALLALTRLPSRLAVAGQRLALLGVAVLLLFPLSGLSDDSIGKASTSMVSKAVSFRSAMWELGRDTLAQAPWHGFGPGTAYAQGRYARSSRYDGLPKDDHPHNVLLATGSALGWPGLLGLLALFVAGTRRPRAGGALALASTAAALALWAANAIDMGGADVTYFPSLAFLLLGLRHASALPDQSGRGSPPGSRGRRAAGLAALLLVAGGLCLLAGEASERHAVRLLDDLPSPPPAADAAQAEVAIARAAALQPLDPAVPLLAARLAGLRRDHDAAARALEHACELFPHSAELAHRLALARAAFRPDDPRVAELLRQAVALDPFGPEAWRRQRDLAQERALAADARAAREALVEAVLLNPAAVAGLPVRGSDDSLELLPGGPGGAALPLADLLAELARRRSDRARLDPPSEARLRMREVELLLALGLPARAEATARAQLAAEPLYLAHQLAQSAIARGAPDEAIAPLSAIAPLENFRGAADLAAALASATSLDVPAFDAALARAHDVLRRHGDVAFELPVVVRLIEARRTVAERRGDALQAVRLADALAFAGR